MFSCIGGFTQGVIDEDPRIRAVAGIDTDAAALMLYEHIAKAKNPSLVVETSCHHFFADMEPQAMVGVILNLITSLLAASKLMRGDVHVHVHASPPCFYICGACAQATMAHKALNLLLAEVTCRAIELLVEGNAAQSFSFEEAESLRTLWLRACLML